MIYIPDTNVLLRFAVRTDPQHSVVLSAIRKLKNGGDEINILPQTCASFGMFSPVRQTVTVSVFQFKKPIILCALSKKFFRFCPIMKMFIKNGAN
jgi:predicted nucleic acid-binding protein